MTRTLASILADAQRTADNTGAVCTILNLNTVGASLFVIRDYPGEETLAKAAARNGPRFIAAVVRPNAPPEMR